MTASQHKGGGGMKTDGTGRSAARRASSYIIEVVAAVAFCYLVLGGSTWSPVVWALFSVVVAGIVILQVFRDTGRHSKLPLARRSS